MPSLDFGLLGWIAFTLLLFWVLVRRFLSWLEDIDHSSLRSFDRDLRRAIPYSHPDWQRVMAMAETAGLTRADVYLLIRRMHYDIATGGDKALKEHESLIESYIASHHLDQPFEGLPNDLRLPLERLRDSLAGREHLLDPLTVQIRELVALHLKENKAQRAYSRWGFVIGVVGLLFAAYAYFYPYVAATAAANSPSTAQQ